MSSLMKHTERAERKREGSRFFYQGTCEFLTDLGIDPRQVLVRSVTADGYETLDLDAEGEHIIRDGELQRTRAAWPNALVGETVMTLMGIDQGRMMQ